LGIKRDEPPLAYQAATAARGAVPLVIAALAPKAEHAAPAMATRPVATTLAETRASGDRTAEGNICGGDSSATATFGDRVVAVKEARPKEGAVLGAAVVVV